jgi:hypothetical protein
MPEEPEPLKAWREREKGKHNSILGYIDLLQSEFMAIEKLSAIDREAHRGLHEENERLRAERPVEELENIRRAAERGLTAAQKRMDSESIDCFQHILNLYREALALREKREGWVLVPSKFLESTANMMEYGRCVATDSDAESKFAFFRDQLRLHAAPSGDRHD